MDAEMLLWITAVGQYGMELLEIEIEEVGLSA